MRTLHHLTAMCAVCALLMLTGCESGGSTTAANTTTTGGSSGGSSTTGGSTTSGTTGTQIRPTREERYTEPLATPQVVEAELSGSIDPDLTGDISVLVDGEAATLSGDTWTKTVVVAEDGGTYRVDLIIDGTTVASQEIDINQ